MPCAFKACVPCPATLLPRELLREMDSVCDAGEIARPAPGPAAPAHWYGWEQFSRLYAVVHQGPPGLRPPDSLVREVVPSLPRWRLANRRLPPTFKWAPKSKLY